ncbi:MAG: hypothetical protein WEA24_08720 [Gemmatimonadota bacterium]
MTLTARALALNLTAIKLASFLGALDFMRPSRPRAATAVYPTPGRVPAARSPA